MHMCYSQPLLAFCTKNTEKQRFDVLAMFTCKKKKEVNITITAN